MSSSHSLLLNWALSVSLLLFAHVALPSIWYHWRCHGRCQCHGAFYCHLNLYRYHGMFVVVVANVVVCANCIIVINVINVALLLLFVLLPSLLPMPSPLPFSQLRYISSLPLSLLLLLLTPFPLVSHSSLYVLMHCHRYRYCRRCDCCRQWH